MADALTTSEHDGFVRSLPTELATKAALDAAVVRDGIVNNLNHLTDCSGQVLVQFVSPDTAYSLTAPSTTLFTRFDTLPVFEVPLRLRHDGASFFVVIDARVSISAAGTATFRVLLRPPDRGSPPPPDPALGYVNVIEFTTTSTSGADITTAPIYLPPAAVQRVIDDGFLSISDSEMGDGTAGTALILPVSIEVWAKTSLITSLPRVQSLIAREWLGEAL